MVLVLVVAGVVGFLGWLRLDRTRPSGGEERSPRVLANALSSVAALSQGRALGRRPGVRTDRDEDSEQPPSEEDVEMAVRRRLYGSR